MLLISDLIDSVYQRSRSRRTTSKSYKRKGIERKELKSYIINLSEDIACLWDVAHEDYMNRDKKEVACCRVDAQIYVSQIIMVSVGTITNANGKFWDRNLWGDKLWITSEISLLSCACSPLCFRWPIDFLCFPPGQQNVLSTSRWFSNMTRKNVSSTMLARQFNPADFCPSSFSAFGRITHTITSRLYFSMKIIKTPRLCITDITVAFNS